MSQENIEDFRNGTVISVDSSKVEQVSYDTGLRDGTGHFVRIEEERTCNPVSFGSIGFIFGNAVLVIGFFVFIQEFCEKPGRQLPRTTEGTAVMALSHVKHVANFGEEKRNDDENFKKIPKKYNHLKKEHKDGLFLRGLEYARGDGINPSSRIQGELLLKKSARQGNEDACAILSCCYGGGIGVPQDWEKEVKWLLKAAEQGHLKAQYNLATNYFLGLGVEKNANIDRYWLKKAAEKGFQPAI